MCCGLLRGDGAECGRTGGLIAFSEEREEKNETWCVFQQPARVLAPLLWLVSDALNLQASYKSSR